MLAVRLASRSKSTKSNSVALHTVFVKQFKPGGQSEFCPEGHHVALVQSLASSRVRPQKLRFISDWAVNGAGVGEDVVELVVVALLSPSMAAEVEFPSVALLPPLIDVIVSFEGTHGNPGPKQYGGSCVHSFSVDWALYPNAEGQAMEQESTASW